MATRVGGGKGIGGNRQSIAPTPGGTAMKSRQLVSHLIYSNHLLKTIPNNLWCDGVKLTLTTDTASLSTGTAVSQSFRYRKSITHDECSG